MIFLTLQLFGQNQNSVEINIDKKLQLKYFDTIYNIESRLNGEWIYLGNIFNKEKVDTTRVSWAKNDTLLIHNGLIYKNNQHGKSKVEKYSVACYNFEPTGSYHFYRVFQKNNGTLETEFTSVHWPRPKVVFFNSKFGILWSYGDDENISFEELEILYPNLLVLGDEKFIRLK